MEPLGKPDRSLQPFWAVTGHKVGSRKDLIHGVKQNVNFDRVFTLAAKAILPLPQKAVSKMNLLIVDLV